MSEVVDFDPFNTTINKATTFFGKIFNDGGCKQYYTINIFVH